MKKVLILGGGGMIGQKLAAHLAANGLNGERNIEVTLHDIAFPPVSAPGQQVVGNVATSGTMTAAVADKPEELEADKFRFASTRNITLRGIPVLAFRISYVGEQGWELHVPFSYGLSLWDMIYEQGAVPVGVETYANSRRLEKSLRLQNADLLTEYNLFEAGLNRPKVKAADFFGKAAYVEQRERDRQPAYLCTMVMTDNVDSNGVARYPVGQWPILDPETNEVLVDELGRRSYVTSIAYGPSVGKNIALGYLPHDYAVEGKELIMECLGTLPHQGGSSWL